ASAVRTVIGSRSGKRTELRVSAGPSPANGVLDSFTLRTSTVRFIHRSASASQDYFGIHRAPKDMRQGRCPKTRSKPGYFSEIEVANFHGRDHHVKRFFTAGARGLAHGLHVIERLNQALVEAEIAQPVFHLAVFHQERSVARHAGKDLLVGVHF